MKIKEKKKNKYVAQKEYNFNSDYRRKKELFKSFVTQIDTSTVLNFMT